MSSAKRVAITTGDVDGIGLEVSVKSLQKLGPLSNTQFILYRSSRISAPRLSAFSRIQALSLQEALSLPVRGRELIEIVSEESPAVWVEEVAKACLRKDIASLVTGPLSKQEIQRAGFSDIGHTDILKRISGKQTAFMMFVGPRFNVLLATGHIPVSAVESSLTRNLLKQALEAAHQAKSFLPNSMRKKPLAVLGLNPHAGDQNLIGRFDDRVLRPALKQLDHRVSLVGPLVPDVAFLPENWKKYSVYVALYHDQGLIPFKMIHGFDAGVHLTLGLPIKRASVDHGTAKDLFGKNKANAGSMIEALKWGVRLAHKG